MVVLKNLNIIMNYFAQLFLYFTILKTRHQASFTNWSFKIVFMLGWIMTVLSLCLSRVNQLGFDPPGHGETGSSQREEFPPSDWPGLHRYAGSPV